MRRHAGSDPTPTASRRGSRGARTAKVAALAAAATLTLGACQWTSTIQTDRQYVPADGWEANVGPLELRNVLVVAEKQGGPGNVVGYAVNSSDQPVDVSVAGAQGGAKIVVPARGSAQLTQANGPATTLAKVDAAPGAYTNVRIETSVGGTDIQAPVLPATEYYKTLAPTGGAAQPTGSAPPAATGTQEPAPTTTATPAPTATQPETTQTAPATPTSTAG